jgi:DNA end-binding protein Ku
VHFRLLEAKRHAPVQQHMVHPETGEIVPYEDVQRGMPLDDGSYALVHAQELSAIEPKPSRDIEVVQFMPLSAVGADWYVRPYYLGPDGDEEAYFALAATLEETEKQGLAHWVMRKREYWGVLRAEGHYLTLDTLRMADEVIERSDLPLPAGREPSEREARMAEQLIESYIDRFDPAAYHDEYRERVLAFVEQKAKGKRPRLAKLVSKPAEPSLADALARSLSVVKEGQRGNRKAS